MAKCSLRYKWESRESPRTLWERGGKGLPGGSGWAEKQRWQPLGQPWAKGPPWAGVARAAPGGASPAGAWQELGQDRDKWGRVGCAPVPCWTCEQEEEEEQEGKP